MNRSLLLLLLVVFGFSACEGPEGPPGRDGDLYMESYDYTLFEKDWVYTTDKDGSNPHYEIKLPIKELTTEVYRYGMINLYLYNNNNNLDDGYYPMGDVYPVEVFRKDGYETWTEYFSCVIYPGVIYVTANCSDFEKVKNREWRPAELKVRVVLSW